MSGWQLHVNYEAAKAFDARDDTSWVSVQQGAGVSGAAWVGQDIAILDANPKEVLAELLTNTRFGAAFPAARIGDWSAYADYCAAAGLFVSPAYVEQQAMADLGAQLMKISNAEVFYSEGLLKITPRGDAALSANGAVYTPDLTVRYVLGDDAFERAEDEDPVQVERVSNADACNMVTVKFYNRANGYALETVEAKDEAHIATYGLRPLDPVEIREVVDAAVARVIAQHLLQRELNVRNVYRFRLGWRFARLEPMDIVALDDAILGCAQTPVRITEIEDSDDVLAIVAEDLALGSGASAVYDSQAGAGAGQDFNVSPGSVNPPVSMDAPAVMTDSGFEVWLAISGANPNWGGAQVWTATDPDGPYTMEGTVYGAARHGVLSAPFAAGSDPDAVNDCAVDLSISGGELTGGTQADADNLSTLAWIEGELVSFQDATLTGPNAYTLETYLRRGVHNTPIAAHAAGERFVRLDSAVFRKPYDPGLVGSLLHIKLPSFNIFGFGVQSLADVAPYAHPIEGPIGAPDAPTGFTVQQVGNVLNFRVDPVATLGLDRVEIRYADPGETVWGNGIPVTNILRGNTDSNGSVPPGEWRFMARSYDLAGSPSQDWAVFDFTVLAGNFQTLATRQEAPDWLGTKTNFVLTWSGVLIPKSQHTGDYYTGNEWIDQWVPDPYATCTYDAAEIDKGLDAPARIWLENVAVLGPGVVAGTADPRQQLDYRLEAGAYDGYEDWSVGSVNFRREKSRLVLDTAVGLAKISGFKTVIDREPVEEEKHGIAIGASGQAVVFDNPFHAAPSITALSDDATPKIATHSADSAAGTTLHLYNTSGTEVGGTGGYRARGV